MEKALWIMICMYFFTGVSTTLLTQLLTYEGLNHSTTLIRPLVNYIGNILAIFIPTIGHSNSLTKPAFSFQSFVSLEVKTVVTLFILSLLDLLNSGFTAAGISFAGSGF